MEHLLQALEIPPKYICQQRMTATGIEALINFTKKTGVSQSVMRSGAFVWAIRV